MANLGVSTPVQIKSTVTAYVQNPKTITSSVGYSWSKLSVGSSHVLALRSDRTLWAWGYNASGQLGDGTATTKSSPVQIGNSLWSQISAGYNYSLGLKQDNTLFAWGNTFRFSSTTSTAPATIYNVSFNGSSDRLSIPNNVAFRFGTGDFTVEWWMNCTTAWSSILSSPGIAGQKQSDATDGWQIYRNTSVNPTKINVRLATGGNNVDYATATTPTTGIWQHWALVRNGSTLTWYLNGAVDATFTGITANITDTGGTFYVGYSEMWGGYFGAGYISNLRIVNGTAVYTSAFTPSTSPLTAITNTVLLTCQSSTIIDNSASAFTITTSGTPTVGEWLPPGYPLGSLSFNGTSQYLTLPANAAYAFGTGDFTLRRGFI